MRIAAFTLLTLLAGCGIFGSDRPPEAPPTPDEIACRAESRDSPERARLMHQWMPGNAINETRLTAELQTAERRAYLECLRRRGVIPRSGGVEAPR
ncbi:MAG TPA: phosphoribosylamine--glycine ligase [Roseomonas sp.]|jgi:hypothetical protein